jgi:hypothetical protein
VKRLGLLAYLSHVTLHYLSKGPWRLRVLRSFLSPNSMKLTTTNTIHSKLYPDVSYTIRSLSEGRRQQLAASIAEHTYRIYELGAEADALLPEDKDAQLQGPTLYKRAALLEKITAIDSQFVRPEWVRIYVKEIQGLEIDGEPATIESFLAEAPTEMFNEAVDLIKAQASLSNEETKN